MDRSFITPTRMEFCGARLLELRKLEGRPFAETGWKRCLPFTKLVARQYRKIPASFPAVHPIASFA